MEIRTQLTYQGKDYLVPLTAEQLTYSRYLDFRKCVDAYHEKEGSEYNTVLHIEKAVGLVVDGPLLNTPFALPGDNMADGCPSLHTGISMLRLYHTVYEIVAEYVPDMPEERAGIRIYYKDQEYTIPVYRVIGGFIRQKHTVAEAVEIQETERLIEMLIKKQGDETGSLEYERELRRVAVLLRKPGERLPDDRGDRETFIDSRMRHFAELPMSDVIRIRFFLNATLSAYAQSLPLLTSGTERRGSAPQGVTV